METADSVLFFDRDSKVRVTPPSKKGAVAYHLHLIHRVQDRRLDFVVKQDAKGRIELDISRFDQPEELVVVSAGRRIVEDDSSAADPTRSRDDRREEIVTPPYALSFRLLPAEGQMETILSLQRHRWEIQTESGKLYLVTGSPNRRDHLLTFFDPAKSHGSLIAEDPYVYVPSQDGATPPRLTVEVLSAGAEDRVWQKAATYHMPDGIDRLVKAGEKPFVFRTSKRDLIAFTPSPRVDLVLPKDPAATSALVQVVPTGLSDKDALKVVLACVYPSGAKGDSAAWVQSHDVAGASRAETFTVDLGHLAPSVFPLTSALALRSILPWKLTSGRYAPEPPMGKSSVPLAAPSGQPTAYAKFLAPKYASHYDFLRFLGAGSGTKKGSSLLDDYLGNGGPDDPNMTPPPTPLPPTVVPGPGTGGGGGTVTPPTPGPAQGPGAAGLGGGFGGGNNSNCGCGQNGAGCKATPPCKGGCGQKCPANGCCQPGPNPNGGSVVIKFPCPPKGRTCGKSEQDCKCNPHQWDKAAVRAVLLALLQKMKNFADLDGPNGPGGFAPCHTETAACDVVAHFWKGNAVGIGAPGPGQYHVTYHVRVIFKPCIGPALVGVGIGNLTPVEPGTIKPAPEPSSGTLLAVNTETGPGSPLTGATFTIDFDDPSNPISTSLNPAIDPNTNLDIAQAIDTLNGGTSPYGNWATGGLTNSIFADVILADAQTLLNISSLLEASGNAVSTAWLQRPVNVLNGPDSWTLSLPNSEWATYQPGAGTTTPPTTTPPPTTPPPPPPPPPPTITKPRT